MSLDRIEINTRQLLTITVLIQGTLLFIFNVLIITLFINYHKLLDFWSTASEVYSY